MSTLTDLVLDGYELEEVSRDSKLYEQTDDSFGPVNIIFASAGKIQNRYYDPCDEYIEGENIEGEKFTTTVGTGGRPTGFVVINDCMMVQCSKWVGTEKDSNSDEITTVSGGETVIYNLIPSAEGPSGTGRVWQIKEPGRCSCTSDGLELNQGEDSCFVGKFMTIDDLEMGCSLMDAGTPGTLGCHSESQPLPVGGIAVGSVLGFLALAALLLALCGYRRRKNNNVGNEDHHYNTKSMDKATAASETENKGGWFSRRNKKSEEQAVEGSPSWFSGASAKGVKTPSQEDEATRKSLFSRNKSKSSAPVANKPNGNKKDAAEGPMTFLPCCGARS